MCDRRRNHPIVSRERQRKTTTRTTGCEFSVLAKENNDRSTWTLRHRSDSRFSLHNHEPSQDTTAHPVLRTLSKEHLSQLTGLANAGIAPKEIRTYMRQNTDTIATQQDIYNRIADARREVCQGQSSINALADQLFREGFWSQFQTGLDGRVKAVLFAHPEPVAYLQAYPDVLILDCTYKTNKYGVPLGHRNRADGPTHNDSRTSASITCTIYVYTAGVLIVNLGRPSFRPNYTSEV